MDLLDIAELEEELHNTLLIIIIHSLHVHELEQQLLANLNLPLDLFGVVLNLLLFWCLEEILGLEISQNFDQGHLVINLREAFIEFLIVLDTQLLDQLMLVLIDVLLDQLGLNK